MNNIKYTLLPLFAVCLECSAANLPTGGQFIGHQGIINTHGKEMEIISTQTNNIIKWDSYNIAANHRVQYDNRNYLNLVKGGGPSVIDGTLLGASRVIIVNPNGISVGSGASLQVNKLMLSTAHISDESIDNFANTGNLSVTSKGMGKVTLLGSVETNNLIVDAGQIIIKDTANLKNENGDPLKHDPLGMSRTVVELKSSTGRIDIGGSKAFDIEKNYGLKATDFVDHRGQTAISTKQEFLNIGNNLSGSYWLTNDVDLGNIKESIGADKAFTGSLDGAFNHISYSMSLDGKNVANAGLFSSIDGGRVSNLMFDRAEINISNTTADMSIGALSGTLDRAYLENIVIKDFNLNLNNNTGSIHTGALAGTLSGITPSVLKNIETKFTKLDAIATNDLKAGAFIGNAKTAATLQGLNVAISDKKLNAIAVNTAALDVATDYKTAIDKASKNFKDSFAKDFVTNNNIAYNKGFLMPFFTEDFSVDYNGKSHQYSSFLKDKYQWFNLANFASLNNDGKHVNANIYNIDFIANRPDLLYFVDAKGNHSSVGQGHLTINKVHLGDITINSQTINQGDKLPNFTIGNEGALNFVNSEGFGDLNVKFEVVNYNGADGTYKITLKENGHNNYTFNVIEGTLTVNKTGGTVTPPPVVVPPVVKPPVVNPPTQKPPVITPPQIPQNPGDSVPNAHDYAKYHQLLQSTHDSCDFCTGRHSLFTTREDGEMHMSRYMHDIRDMSLAQNSSEPEKAVDMIIDAQDKDNTTMTATNSADYKNTAI